MDEGKSAPGPAAGASVDGAERLRASIAALRAGLDSEAGLFEQLVAEVERLEQAYHDRDWTSSLTIAQGLDGHARRIEAAEADRQRQVTELAPLLGLSPGAPLSGLVGHLPPDERLGLEESGRRLRAAVFRMKTATRRLRWSAETLSGTLERVLAGLFPHRRGRIYGRYGKPREIGESVLVDHSL